MLMYYLYVIKINNDFYIGYTEDLEKRLKQHRAKGEISLIYYEAYQLKNLATNSENKLKHYCSAWRALKNRITA